ncbi:hypothetical protein [Candidatus Methanodesulfokora washburnensis]|uniref:Uncharacterized protein n=1 Tax=Candidatus Methanodesulfokora washburnensis TaxID=2478471 RepID=A0A429GJA0_9CREN|nr:hypothetical protein [Candidatus Methanodesulfokores washburnensis]RSN73931.1 hypothetical protein D6D85_09115 [Candidatus Methanodesulfokores washburnensis]
MVLVPKLRESLARNVLEALKKLRDEGRELILLYTEKSSDACKIIKSGINEAVSEKVEGENLDEEWSSRAVAKASGGGTILTVGEVPKGVLLKIVEKINGKDIKLASLIMRPVFQKDKFLESLDSVISVLKGENGRFDLSKREEIGLELLEI